MVSRRRNLLTKQSKNYYNKLQKVSKRDKKKEKKLTKKLSPDEGVTKRIGGEDHLPSVSKLIRLLYQAREILQNHEQTGAGVHKETHTPRKSQQYTRKGIRGKPVCKRLFPAEASPLSASSTQHMQEGADHGDHAWRIMGLVYVCCLL